MLQELRKLYNPTIFQGDLSREGYFEGWYFKLVDGDERRRLAIIAGISLTGEREASHAFIQSIDGNTAETRYHRFPIEQFHASKNALRIDIGPSRFTADSIELNVDDEHGKLLGTLSMQDLNPWPRRLLAPGIMGWYSFVPFMECYHGVVSLDHELQGSLEVDADHVDFTGGRGYTEKDWGTSFPSAYLWMQSNHFDSAGTSLMASVARIPWVRHEFTGFLATLLHEGEIHLFATYSGATLEDLTIDDRRVRFAIRDRRYRLEIEANRAVDESSAEAAQGFGLLRSPRQGEMQGRIGETLTASIGARLYRRRRFGGDLLVFHGEGSNAGLEVEASEDQLR